MLTATYTLVALSVEQASVRVSLQSFQKYVRSTLMQQNSITLSQLEYACETLNRLYQACHWRKTEIYLIPAIRVATERADQLLDELSRLNQAALEAARQLQQQLGTLGEGRDEQVSQTCERIETFCTSLLQRLEKEEQELFAIARRVIGGEAWFSLANQLMMHDKHLEESRRAPAAIAPPPPARPPSTAPAEREPREGDIVIADLQVLPVVKLDADEVVPLPVDARTLAGVRGAKPPLGAALSK